MKINRPSKFYPSIGENGDPTLYNSLAWSSVLVSRGDIIKKYAEADYQNEAYWHIADRPSNDDKWVKISFDGGLFYPLKFQFRNQLVVQILKDNENGEPFKALQEIEFSLFDYPISVYEAAKAGLVSLVSLNERGAEATDGEPPENNLWYANISGFNYQFDDERKVIKIILLADLPINSIGLMLKVGVDGSNSNALAVSSPLYSMTTGAIPTVYDSGEEGRTGYGICNMLDSRFPSITCLTKFEDINAIELKVVSADPTKSGRVCLQFVCGEHEWCETIPVGTTEKWEKLKLIPDPLTGTMVINRIDHVDDNMPDTSIFITNIRMERI